MGQALYHDGACTCATLANLIQKVGLPGREKVQTFLHVNELKVGLGVLQITSAKRCPLVWPWVGRSQQILLNLIKRCSNQHAEIFMNETNMRRFESVFTN